MIATHDYPQLRQLFGAYLNVDFVDASGSVRSALATYRADTAAAHREAAVAEIDRLVTAAPPLRIADAVIALGAEVAVATPGEALGLLATIRRAIA
jgi:hypothetical protein